MERHVQRYPQTKSFRKRENNCDIAIVLVAKSIPQIEALCNQVVEMVANWLNEAGLAMAPQQTEAVLISSKKVVEYCNIKVGNCLIQSRPYINYLAIIIDRGSPTKST